MPQGSSEINILNLKNLDGKKSTNNTITHTKKRVEL